MVFDEVQADLETEGYEVIPFILPACAVDAPHRRDRVWFIAYSKSNRNRRGLHGVENENDRFWKPKERGQNDNEYWNDGKKRNVTDTESQSGEWMRPKLRKFSQQKQRESGGTHSQMGNNATDSDGIRLRGESNGFGKSRFTNEAGEIGNWENFPTQSPICNGDDGFSSRLDRITFPKWRNESIKAGGNAIVPQVAYEIFKAIELTI
jgi:DNA (cytosine-5)-methyltransferase 1